MFWELYELERKVEREQKDPTIYTNYDAGGCGNGCLDEIAVLFIAFGIVYLIARLLVGG